MNSLASSPPSPGLSSMIISLSKLEPIVDTTRHLPLYERGALLLSYMGIKIGAEEGIEPPMIIKQGYRTSPARPVSASTALGYELVPPGNSEIPTSCLPSRCSSD